MSKWFKLSFALAAILVVVPLAGCLKGPNSVSETQFRGLLTLADIQKLSSPSDISLTGTFYDYKTDANTDPTKTLHMESYYGMVFVSDDQSAGVALTLVDFDSPQIMQQYLLSIQSSSQLQTMEKPIASSSMEKEFNTQGLGSVVVFQRGTTLVELLTGVPDGAKPFLTLSSLEALARQIAAKL